MSTPIAIVGLAFVTGPEAKAWSWPTDAFKYYRPDLKVKDIKVDMGASGEIFVRAKIKNSGNAAITNKRIRFMTAISYVGGMHYSTLDVTLTLTPGQSTWVYFPQISNVGRPFEIVARVWADTAQAVDESDEGNNWRVEGLRNTSFFSYDEVWSR